MAWVFCLFACLFVGVFFFRWEVLGPTVLFCLNRDLGVQQLGFLQIGILGSDCVFLLK